MSARTNPRRLWRAINTIDESPLLATMDAFRMIEANHFQIVATRDADWSA
jgi:hypothetical protein